jgi:hypothetical protein
MDYEGFFKDRLEALCAEGRRSRRIRAPANWPSSRGNAPHIKCSVVMPGQIGTSIRANTRKIHSGDRESDAIDAAGLAQARERFALLGRDVSQLSDDQLRNLVAALERGFRDEALTSATQAATIILDGVKADRWRILRRGGCSQDRRNGAPVAGTRLRHRVLR